MISTPGKLPSALRTALQGGEYDAGAFELRVYLDATVGGDVELEPLEWDQTTLSVFGAHPKEVGELEAPTLSFRVDNTDGRFSQFSPTTVLPFGLGNYSIVLEVRERITNPGTVTTLFRQVWALAEITVTQQAEVMVAQFLGVHPLGGWLARKWEYDEGDPVDWNGYSHDDA